MKKKIVGNYKFCLGVFLGFILSATTVFAAVNSGEISYDNSKSGLSATNVKDALDETYEKVKKTDFKVGDYVSMTPTKTSFTIPQTLTGYTSNRTINPSELNLWRVIRINSDGTVDMVSEYVSSISIYFNGSTGYQNCIGTLNYIAKQYENRKYTSGSRHMGYDSTQTEYITDTSALTSTTEPQTSTTSSSNVTSATEAKGLGDVGYETDYNRVKTALGTVVANQVGTTTAKAYWLASRQYKYYSSTNWYFNGRSVNTSGSLGINNMYDYYEGSFRTNLYASSRAVRPIVTLKSGVKASSGDGSSSSPYVLD